MKIECSFLAHSVHVHYIMFLYFLLPQRYNKCTLANVLAFPLPVRKTLCRHCDPCRAGQAHYRLIDSRPSLLTQSVHGRRAASIEQLSIAGWLRRSFGRRLLRCWPAGDLVLLSVSLSQSSAERCFIS